jgi:hypothetical protein
LGNFIEHLADPASSACPVKDGVDGMNKCAANEASAGLYFVQQLLH